MYVYLIRSQHFPNRKYIGLTNNVSKRLLEHNSGNVTATYKFRPWQLVTHTWFDDADKAVSFETYLKGGSGHAFAKKHFW